MTTALNAPDIPQAADDLIREALAIRQTRNEARELHEAEQARHDNILGLFSMWLEDAILGHQADEGEAQFRHDLAQAARQRAEHAEEAGFSSDAAVYRALADKLTEGLGAPESN